MHLSYARRLALLPRRPRVGGCRTTETPGGRCTLKNTTTPAATTLALVLGALLGGCATEPACGDGAASPTEAAEELLHAAADDDLARACTVTLDVAGDALRSGLAEIATFLADVGGPDEVAVREVPGRQMGSHHVVEVVGPGSSGRTELDVVQSGRRYFVLVGEQPVGDEPTTDPTPRPSSDPPAPDG